MVSVCGASEARPTMDAIWAALAAIPDPEIPVISLVELGVVRDVCWRDGALVVTLTPTYSGCPAMSQIAEDIEHALSQAGLGPHRIDTVLAPAAKRRLAEYGIAPPGPRAAVQMIDIGGLRRREPTAVACPRCGSLRTRELSRFGSTPCKAQHRCEECLEPFDYFKPH